MYYIFILIIHTYFFKDWHCRLSIIDQFPGDCKTVKEIRLGNWNENDRKLVDVNVLLSSARKVLRTGTLCRLIIIFENIPDMRVVFIILKIFKLICNFLLNKKKDYMCI